MQRPLAEKWEIWREELLGIPEHELDAMERAFFCGAGIALAWLMQENISADEGCERLQNMVAELRERIRKVRVN